MPPAAFSFDYYVKDGDTLWDLAEHYLRSPWDWPFIVNSSDRSHVEDVYTIPNGHLLWIPSISDISHLPIPFDRAGAPDIVIQDAKRKGIYNRPPTTKYNLKPTAKSSALTKPITKPETSIQNYSSGSRYGYRQHPSTKNTKINQYYYFFLTKKDGLVRAYIDDRHVTIPVSKLIELYSKSNPGFTLPKNGHGVAVSKTLVRKMLGIDQKDKK